MFNDQKEFIRLALACGALRFGEFTLKSGRVSPYFFNAGHFNTGETLHQLGTFYAQAIERHPLEFDLLFGPAYKGIPLVAAVSIALFAQHNKNVPWAFNRKEAKDHGEGGSIVGSPLAGRVLLIDDVMTAGTAIRESMQLIKQHPAQLAGVMVMLDRQERGLTGNRSAIQDIEQTYHIPVIRLITMTHLIDYLQDQPQYAQALEQMHVYREQYGVCDAA